MQDKGGWILVVADTERLAVKETRTSNPRVQTLLKSVWTGTNWSSDQGEGKTFSSQSDALDHLNSQRQLMERLLPLPGA